MMQVQLLVKILGLVKEDINATDEGNNTALIVAIKNGLKDVAKALIIMDADLTIRDKTGKTAMDWAYLYKQWDIVENIVLRLGKSTKQNVDINCKSSESSDYEIFGSSLISAVASGQKEIAKILIDQGVNLDKQEPLNGYTALMWAIANSQIDIAEILIRKGADLDKRDKGGRTALDWAAVFDRKEIIRFIEEIQKR